MKLLAKTLFAIGILTLFANGVFGWRSFKILFASFPYEFDPDVWDIKIKIENTSAGESTLNIWFNVKEEQIDDITLRFVIALEGDEGNFTTLINRSVNFCKFLKLRATEPVLRLIYDDMLKQGNFIKLCPIKKGTYSLREYRIDEEMLPSYVPETSFFVAIALEQANNKLLFKGTLHGKIDKSKGFNNLKMFSLG